MKKVIDSNQLQTPELRDFLSKSELNFAVLPDFVAMEAYKGNTLKSIFKSMDVLSEFPKQVLILKGSAKVCALSGRRKGLQRRMIDDSQTAEFTTYIDALRDAELGDVSLRNQLIFYGEEASQHLAMMREHADSIRLYIKTLGESYSEEERSFLRERSVFSSDLINKIVKTVMQMAAQIFHDSDHARRLPQFSELPNTFVFRATFAIYLLGLTRLSQGGFDRLSSDKLRNDFVDMIIVAYATYFDGIMSSDRRVNEMFGLTSQMLVALFDAEVPSLTR